MVDGLTGWGGDAGVLFVEGDGGVIGMERRGAWVGCGIFDSSRLEISSAVVVMRFCAWCSSLWRILLAAVECDGSR